MYQNPLEVFQTQPLLKLTRVMSLNGLLRALVTNYYAALSSPPDYFFMGLTKAEVLDGLKAEIQIVLAELEQLDPLKREG